MRSPRLGCFAAFVVAGALSRAASFDDRIEALFRPPLGEMLALSPDGQRAAYTAQAGRDLTVVILNFDPPGPRRTVQVDPERDATAAENRPSARLRFMRWGTATRLVFATTERVVPLPPIVLENGRTAPNPDGPTLISPIMAVDADGRQRGTLVDARDFQETPAEARKSLADLLRTTKELQATRDEPVRWRMPHLEILGFLPGQRDQLIIETRGAYNLPTQRLVDLRTGSVREFGGNWPVPPGEPLIFDWYRLKVVGERLDAVHPSTAWRDEEFSRMQRDLETKFPRRVVEILDWSETRARVLFRVTGGSDPGRIFVFQRPEDLAVEIMRRAPWLSAAKLHETRFFEFASPDGAMLSGYVTWPGQPRVSPPPLLVIFPSGFPGRAQSSFDPEAQALADLGFAVARLNPRSGAGIRPEDLSALRATVDRVSVDDARAAIDWIATCYPDRPFDRRHLAAIGRGFGGYLAVRALQLQPKVFRCGIALDAPLDLNAWLRRTPPAEGPLAAKFQPTIPVALLDHAGADWQNLSVLEQAETLKAPLLLLVEPGRDAAIDGGTSEFRARLQSLGRPLEHAELDADFGAAQPAARAAIYRKMEAFLQQHLPGYAVTIGPTTEVK